MRTVLESACDRLIKFDYKSAAVSEDCPSKVKLALATPPGHVAQPRLPRRRSLSSSPSSAIGPPRYLRCPVLVKNSMDLLSAERLTRHIPHLQPDCSGPHARSLSLRSSE